VAQERAQGRVAVNNAALQAELAARGFDYLAARGATYINLANAQLDASYLWPYLKTTVTGSASAGTATAVDLGSVYMVQDTANGSCPLLPSSEIGLLERWGDLTLTGTPWTYYVLSATAGGTVHAFPVGGTIKAFYYAIAPDLAGPTDTPLSPTKYHGLIVDMAVQMAYRDSDDHDAADRLQAWIDRQMQAMVLDLFAEQVQAGIPMRFRYAEWDS
jgi:hypothetical protein